MAYDTKIHRRRSLRLKGYDYRHVGAYFVTIVTQGRSCLFGEIVGQEMQLNEAGEMIRTVWEALPQRFPGIEIEGFVVMPNHLHGIIAIHQPVGVGLVPAQDTNSPDHGTTTSQSTEPTDVGAGLVPAQDTNDHTTKRATTRVAPTNQNPDRGVENMSTVPNRATTRGAPTLGDVIGAYKSLSTVEYVRGVKTMEWTPFHGRLWQRNYYEHIVRHEDSLRDLQQYILDNPARWAFDKENPLAEKPEIEKP